jgi:hypothetical protein
MGGLLGGLDQRLVSRNPTQAIRKRSSLGPTAWSTHRRARWLPGMDSNHELDMFFGPCNLLILQKSVMSPKASKAGLWYKIGTKKLCTD